MIVMIVISVFIIFVVFGVLISVFVVMGFIWLRDVYLRVYVVGKVVMLGVMFLLFGVFLYFIGIEGYVNM